MKRLSVGQATFLAALIIILILTAVWAVAVWNATGEAVMDKHGWIALGFGSFFSLVVGCGLMALMFFSSRHGYDEVADPFRKKQEPPSGRAKKQRRGGAALWGFERRGCRRDVY